MSGKTFNDKTIFQLTWKFNMTGLTKQLSQKPSEKITRWCSYISTVQDFTQVEA